MKPPQARFAHLEFRIGQPVYIHRGDGSNRVSEGTFTSADVLGIGLSTPAVFAVGEVVEFVFAPGGQQDKVRYRARILYRTSNRYGLGLLREPEPLPGGGDYRLHRAAKLLAGLKAAYDSLPAAHQEVVCETLMEQTDEPGIAA